MTVARLDERQHRARWTRSPMSYREEMAAAARPRPGDERLEAEIIARVRIRPTGPDETRMLGGAVALLPHERAQLITYWIGEVGWTLTFALVLVATWWR